MAGISISELISKDDTNNVSDGFIPISINNNTFKIKAGTFLTDTNNCINTFIVFFWFLVWFRNRHDGFK